MVSTNWIADAVAELLRLRLAPAGWSYRPTGDLAVEPTALAALALLAQAAPTAAEREAAQAAAARLAAMQQANGALGVTENLSAPNWPTSYAILLWSALNQPAPARRGIDWLLETRGVAVVRQPTVMGHDSMLVGWPWVQNTHSWIEPTSLAVLAFRRQGRTSHPRVQEALRLIRDRALPRGGWNYGNVSVFGTELRPHPAPTGMALLALAGLDAQVPFVERACAYLERLLPQVRSAPSLAWGLLALRAWQRLPAAADEWLAEAFELARTRSDPAQQIASLLLAAGPGALPLLGVASAAPRNPS